MNSQSKPKCPVCQTDGHSIKSVSLESVTLTNVILSLDLKCNSCQHEFQGDMKYQHYYYTPTKGDYVWNNT